MADDPEAENENEKEYPGGRVGLNARVIKDKENDVVIIEEINHGYLNDGYDKFLYEDEGTKLATSELKLFLTSNKLLRSVKDRAGGVARGDLLRDGLHLVRHLPVLQVTLTSIANNQERFQNFPPSTQNAQIVNRSD